MKKNYSFLKYLVYIVVIFILLYLQGSEIKDNYTFQSFVFRVFLGAVLGSEHLLSERKKSGKWKVNFGKLIILGIPMLLYSLTFLLLQATMNMSLSNETLNFLWGLNLFSRHTVAYMYLCQMILGYILITGFYKLEETNTVR